jgi:hypothetical protein
VMGERTPLCSPVDEGALPDLPPLPWLAPEAVARARA